MTGAARHLGDDALAAVVLHVDSLTETADFYTSVFGFEVVEDGSDGSDGILTVSREESRLYFREERTLRGLALDNLDVPIRGLPQGSEVVISVGADDLESVRTRALDAGAHPVGSSGAASDYGGTAFLRDPNGFLIRLRGAERHSADVHA